MEKKYYDIIDSLIRQNEKFAGCEPILNDIIQDVYEHSKVVLNSVSNEDVINAYLKKVIATSLITVPKKLKFDTRNKHRIIRNIESITKVTLPAETVSNEISLLEKDKNINVSENVSIQIETPVTENKTPILSEDIQVEQDTVNEVQDDTLVLETENNEIEAIEEKVPFLSEDIQVEQDTVNEVQDDTLVLETENNEIETSEEDEIPFLSEDLQIEQDIVDDVQEDTLILETEDNKIETSEEDEIPFLSEDLQVEQDIVDDVQEDTLVLETEDDKIELGIVATESKAEQVEEYNIDKTLVDKMINGVAEETNAYEELSLAEDKDSLETLDNLIVESDELDITEESTLKLEDDFELTDNTDTILEENIDSNMVSEPAEDGYSLDDDEKAKSIEQSLSVPDFACFSYEPESPEFDEAEICAELKELDEKYPNKKLFQICALKFKEQRSISEIASTLVISEEDVLNTLNDIIELVKD